MNGIRIFLFLSMIVLSLCLTVGAWSTDQTDEQKIQKEYEAADLNKDGVVDENEYKSYISKKFGSAEEKKGQESDKKGAGERENEQFVTKGEGGKQKTSFEEFLNGRLRFFNEADANHDGLLSLQEYTQMKLIEPAR